MDYSKIAARIANDKNMNVGRKRQAGEVFFRKDVGPVQRDLRVSGFEFDADAYKDLAEILWAAQRSHSYSSSALQKLSKMNSSKFSPDGLLGGKGYIQAIKDMRTSLSNVVEFLSSFTDTIYDEINAPHWKSTDDQEANNLVQDAEHVRDNSEQFVEEQMQEESQETPEEVQAEIQTEDEPETYENPTPDVMNPVVESNDYDQDDEEESGSLVLTSSDKSKHDCTKCHKPIPSDQETESFGVLYHKECAPKKTPKKSTSLNVDALPGPRVDFLGPAMGDGWEGSFNSPDDTSSDNPNVHNDFSQYPGDGDYDLANPPNITYGDVKPQNLVSKPKKRKADVNYSQLPGADNDRPLNFYQRGLTEEENQLLREMAKPDYDPEAEQAIKKSLTDLLWQRDIR